MLNDLFGIQARGGCSCAGPYGHELLSIDSDTAAAHEALVQKGRSIYRPGWVRLGFNFFFSNESANYVISAVEFIARYAPVLMKLYSVDEKSGVWSVRQHLVENQPSMPAICLDALFTQARAIRPLRLTRSVAYCCQPLLDILARPAVPQLGHLPGLRHRAGPEPALRDPGRRFLMEQLDLLMQGFAGALTPINLLWVVVGCLLGTAVGVLPGLGSSMAVALLLPMTFALDPTAAFILFAGVYFGGLFGDSTMAILLNTPGQASAITSTFKGHRMAAATGTAGAGRRGHRRLRRRHDPAIPGGVPLADAGGAIATLAG